MSIKIYLDSCIFVAYFCAINKMKDTNKQEEKIMNFIKTISKNDNIKFYTSDFTFTETIKVLIHEKKISSGKVFEFVYKVSKTQKIDRINFEIIEPQGDYASFFVGIQEILLDTKPHLADAIHIRIMLDNKIVFILTFDKGGFEKEKLLNPLFPDEFLHFYEGLKKK